MAFMKRPRLSSVEALTGHRLRLTFVDGRTYTLDFAPLLDASPGLTPLREASAFAGARVIPGEGWAVTWPALDIQIGADTLWLDVQAQQASDENTSEIEGYDSKVNNNAGRDAIRRENRRAGGPRGRRSPTLSGPSGH